MATPIDNKQLLQQFLEGSAVEEPKETIPKIEKQKPETAGTNPKKEKVKQNLRFSITVPTALALNVREYVNQATIQHLMKGGNYSISQFFSEAAEHYIQAKKSD